MHGTPGDHHDAVVTRDTAPDIRARARLGGEDAFSFGVLCRSPIAAALAV
jgi:hypothetical protein